MHKKFESPYNPKEAEDRIYTLWEESGLFNPDISVEKGHTSPDADPFTIMLPPPNVTGTLHTGHAIMLAIEDIMIRYKRMQGYKALWLPGTDHAAIATQSKVEKELSKKEKKTRHDLGRDEFLKRVEEFAQSSHDTIVGQVRKMGSSIDWSREAYTLDEARSFAVRTAFKRMYDLGLIYRGNRIVNWDPKGQTTISDDEVQHEERTGTLYTFKYSKDFPFTIATTRPETKVGDTAVAVHPDDKRFSEYLGKTFTANFCGVEINVKVVPDEHVDPEFGTGALGVTPAHSMTDFDIAKRHDLPVVQVIDEYARMTVGDERLKGKKVKEARETIVNWLKEEDLLVEEKEVAQNISLAERTGAVIEPLPKLQWFIDVNKEFTLEHSNIQGIESGSTTTLKTIMKTVVNNGQITILPERFNKNYSHWIDNLRDWCISRQIWYGHQVPVWYKGEEIHVDINAPEDEGWEQDPDTLDTWFSAGLWTFSTLGWPENTPDLQTYHPTDVLETGYDILFFWVARMILMTGCLLGDIPFHTVYLHGLVRDEKGRKMSKSLGNIVDPLEKIEQFGADALRMALIIGTTPGGDSILHDSKIKAYKHFANKLWNITRFIETNTAGFDGTQPELTKRDIEILNELTATKQEVEKHMDSYRFYLAAEHLYHYIWHTVADVIIEEMKPRLKDGNKDESAAYTLRAILTECLTMLHPFMPFVTEEIWQTLEYTDGILMVKQWGE